MKTQLFRLIVSFSLAVAISYGAVNAQQCSQLCKKYKYFGWESYSTTTYCTEYRPYNAESSFWCLNCDGGTLTPESNETYTRYDCNNGCNLECDAKNVGYGSGNQREATNCVNAAFSETGIQRYHCITMGSTEDP